MLSGQDVIVYNCTTSTAGVKVLTPFLWLVRAEDFKFSLLYFQSMIVSFLYLSIINIKLVNKDIEGVWAKENFRASAHSSKNAQNITKRKETSKAEKCLKPKWSKFWILLSIMIHSVKKNANLTSFSFLLYVCIL